jgi:hypothetical protein
MYKLAFFVPQDHAEPVKQAVFAAGGGRYEQYDMCSWETLGTGQFRPLEGSDPFLGSTGRLERVPELRVEMICRDELVRPALAALVQAHPYEEPAYDLVRVFTADELPAGLP